MSVSVNKGGSIPVITEKIDKLDCHQVCLQSGKTTISGLPFVFLARTYLVKE